MTLQVGVKVLLQNKQGQYLILKRSNRKYPGMNGVWDIPGGRIDPGTPLLENLKREIKEETGLELNGEVDLVKAQDIFSQDNTHIVRLTYTGFIEGEPEIDPNEHDQYKWVTLNELRELEDLDTYLKQLLQGQDVS